MQAVVCRLTLCGGSPVSFLMRLRNISSVFVKIILKVTQERLRVELTCQWKCLAMNDRFMGLFEVFFSIAHPDTHPDLYLIQQFQI